MTSPILTTYKPWQQGRTAAIIEQKYVSQRVPKLFPGEFRRLNSGKQTLGMIVDDLSRRLFIAAFIFLLCANNRAVKSAETVFFFASIYLLQRYSQNRRGVNQEYHPKFLLVQLRSAIWL